jgi:glycerol-3-phosphate dehydrogenase
VGAAIMREACRLGLSVLLVEQRDFAWGTSSRSSKMVHGGLRYLKTFDVRMTLESVRDRMRLLSVGRGLVEPVDFLLTRHRGDKPGALGYQLGLTLYDLMAGQMRHRHYNLAQIKALVPELSDVDLLDAYEVAESLTDDARLTLRVLAEGIAAGGVALNYVRAETLLRTGGHVAGLRLRDMTDEHEYEVRTRLVVNATGAWADRLRGMHDGHPLMRPLRGSHLIFPGARLPLARVVSLNHPQDRRPVSIAPWHGVTIVGNTDLDHKASLDEEPQMSAEEATYLMAAVERAFPSLGLTLRDASACYSGVRPVIDSGQADPSKESREHLIRYEDGLLTVTGGKLTTFQTMAVAALNAVPRERLPAAVQRGRPPLEPMSGELPASPAVGARLLGRFGNAAAQVVASAQPGELEFIPETDVLWVELKWAARSEAVLHLDDLMLRRVTLGLLLPKGGQALLPQIRALCQSELGWSDERWQSEQACYRDLWMRCYRPPVPAGVQA